MTLDLNQTIVAVSSGLAAGSRAIVRISGAETQSILSRLLSFSQKSETVAFFESPFATHCRAECMLSFAARSGGHRRISVSCYWWPDDRSFTGECSAEIHLLGSLPLVESLVETIVHLGARPAERGEFILRSFLAGKVDLTQVEAVLAVIEAGDNDELEQALAQLGGNISTPVRRLRDQLVELTAHLEAGLDFVEEDIQFITTEELLAELLKIGCQLKHISGQLESRGSRTRKISVVLVGLPNAGKSSLFNAIVNDKRAIVSDQAGTTRDAITRWTPLGDLRVELVDTAGIEELHENSPRKTAQSLLAERLTKADAVLFCLDLSQPFDRNWLDGQLSSIREKSVTLLVGTKQDVALESAGLQVDLAVSTRDLSSINRLKEQLADHIQKARGSFKSQALHDTQVRCKASMELAQAALSRAITAAADNAGEELVAAELRGAIDDLSSIIGEVHTEDILGQIFSRFCIGK